MRTLITIILLANISLQAATITVNQNGWLYSIKRAIEQSNSGDTIVVEHGIYREKNILIEKPLTLIGKNLPTLDGENKYEIITIQSHHVTVQGFNIINSGKASMHDVAGIGINNSQDLKVLDNILENTFFAIHIANSKNVWVRNNKMTANAVGEQEIGNGIHLWKCKNASIINNHVSGHRDGIYLEFTTNSIISNNISETNKRYGLHFMFSHDDEYRGNHFINNGAGVAVMYTQNVTMINNTFRHNWGSASYGLLLKDIRDSHVEGNKFETNSVGIFMEGSSRINFFRNEFRNNGWAVKLQASCDDNVFTRNNFTGNSFDISTNGVLVLNKLDHNYWDKYEGYDLKKDGIGDVPHHPVSMYAMIVERIPSSVMLWRSFLVYLMDKTERVVPVITPENMKDDYPTMKPNDYIQRNN